MADSFVQVPPDSTGKQVDAASLPVGGQTVLRQRVVLGDNTGTATYATILSAGPAGTEGGLVVRNIPSGTQSVVGQVAVTGTVSLGAGTANIGTINNISATVVVSGQVSLGPVTSNIGTINNISATVAVSGQVSLGPGTSNIGTVNNISATVVVAGEVANGASLSTTNKPVLMGGNTSAGGAGGLMVTMLMDTSGRQIVNVNTMPAVVVSGAVSIAAGTSNIGTINNISATVVVSGAVSLAAGANNIGTINNISAAVVLAAGSANIGSINNISATVVVSGAVSLAAGANNIGTINNISAAVVLAAGSANIGSINNISATVVVSGAVSLAAGANNIGTINNISAAVVLAAGAANIGTINNISAAVVLAAGANNIGTINNISANVTVNNTYLVGISAPAAASNATQKAAWGDPYGRQVVIINHPSLYNTASHGPKCVTCSTSATTAIVTAPGAGLCVYITKIAATNGSATLTRGDVYGASATATAMASLHMAASGGGFIMDYDPPIKVLSNTALNCRVKPSVSKCMFNVHFYVGPK